MFNISPTRRLAVFVFATTPRIASFASLLTESKTGIVWSGSSVQWPLASIIFALRRPSGTPLNLRERALTIDHDGRISPRAPFERVLAIERAIVSDIQAFGYNPDDAEQGTPSANLLAVWYLVRQDLYLNDQATAFLIVHWRHTLNLISLLDVIPGDGTELISE